ncbi:MAG: MopE-related protein, partial [Gammaproteobacteria bacterium]|nr:MopE-related protein [Gammaproteobacteria bacterium]
MEPQWTWWRNGDLTNFCPQPPPNQAPNGRIDSPAVDQTITAGSSVSFAGTGTDSDGDTPLRYNWNFGGGAPGSNQQDPGAVTFNSVGTFTVTFTVTDSLGLSDQTPATRRITVTAPPQNCSDVDGDGFAIEGGSCGPIDCDDSNAAVNPGAAEICTDGIDNNCNALVDAADPTASDCPTNRTCRDNDGDGFSPEGGLCGPVDCNDQDPATSPGANEDCNDNRDNDCDGATDAADDECNGADCIGQLTAEPEPPLSISRASWDAGERELEVEGDQAPAGAQAVLSNPDTGELLDVEVVERSGEWEFELEGLRSSEVPCRVRVELGGRSGVQRVANAPADCRGGTQPPPDPDPEPEPEPNRAPNGVIDSPAGDRSITAGQAITFAGSGSDSDGNTP